MAAAPRDAQLSSQPSERKVSKPAAHPHPKMAHASCPHHCGRRAVSEVERRRYYARAEEVRRRANYDYGTRRSYETPRRGLLFTDIWPEGSWHQR